MDFETNLRYEQEKKSEVLGALLSFILPGIGSMYAGKVGKGIMFLFGAIIGYILFVIPGLIVHLFSIISGYNDVKISNTLLGLEYLKREKE
jgi:TM2 domain-containing membrane protein YozV